jgi:Fic family protein
VNATYVPPPVEDMLLALDQLEKYIHTTTDLSPLVQTGMVHSQFEAIHPFLDGNGRVGRLLVSLLLCAWGLLPQPLLQLSAYFDANRQEYYDRLLRVSQQGDWEGWLNFFLFGVSVQALDAIKRITRLQELYSNYQDRLQSERAAKRLHQTLDLLFERPIISVRQVETALFVTYHSAQRYVDKMVEIGLLREVTGQARNRLYRSDEILNAIESPIRE